MTDPFSNGLGRKEHLWIYARFPFASMLHAYTAKFRESQVCGSLSLLAQSFHLSTFQPVSFALTMLSNMALPEIRIHCMALVYSYLDPQEVSLSRIQTRYCSRVLEAVLVFLVKANLGGQGKKYGDIYPFLAMILETGPCVKEPHLESSVKLGGR